MAVKMEHVFFQTAVLVTNGLITGQNAVPQQRKTLHLP